MEGLEELQFPGMTLQPLAIQVGSRMQCLRRRRMKVKALLEFQMHNVTVPFLSADVDAPVVTDPELTRQKFSILTGPQLSKAAPSEAQPQHSDAVPLPL